MEILLSRWKCLRCKQICGRFTWEWLWTASPVIASPVKSRAVAHFDITGKVCQHAIRRAVVEIVRHKIVVERQVVKVRTKSMWSQWIGTRSCLRFSTNSHSKVLMAVVGWRAFVVTCIYAGDVFGSRFWILIIIEPWACDKCFSLVQTFQIQLTRRIAKLHSTDRLLSKF